MKEYLDILWAFTVIGATTFGGGYAMIPVLQRELIEKRGWIDMDEVMDYYTIAQITPGIIAVNVATFVGFKRKGLFGGAIATIAFILPGVSLVILIALFLKQFADYEIVRHVFIGIRISVCALILDAVLKLFKGLFKNYKAVILFIAAFVLSAVFSLSPVFIIIGAGLTGFVFFRASGEVTPGEISPDETEGKK